MKDKRLPVLCRTAPSGVLKVPTLRPEDGSGNVGVYCTNSNVTEGEPGFLKDRLGKHVMRLDGGRLSSSIAVMLIFDQGGANGDHAGEFIATALAQELRARWRSLEPGRPVAKPA
jgi:hypothetical protein